MRSDDALLLDMLIAARRVERFVQGMTYPEFRDNDMAQSAVIRELQVLGEAARLVSRETRDVLNDIDWRTMIGMGIGSCMSISQSGWTLCGRQLRTTSRR